MKKFIIVVMVLMVIVILGITIKSRLAPKKENATTVRLASPQLGNLIEAINAPGEVKPRSKVEISARVSARITELPFEEGDAVQKGDVLIRLDASDLQARLKSAQASHGAQAARIEVAKVTIETQKAHIDGARASLEQAQKHLARQKSLLQSKDVSQSVVDEAQSRTEELEASMTSALNGLKSAELELEVLHHNLDEADAQIAQVRENLSYTTIAAPINGTITRINAEEGEIAMTGTMNNPGTVILEVADLSEMLVEAEVDEADIGRIQVGQKARVHIHTWPDKEFQGVVDAISLTHSIGGGGSKHFITKIALETDKQKMYLGLTADVDIEIIEHQKVLTIPSQAILSCDIDELPSDIRDNNPQIDPKKTFCTVVYRTIDGKAMVTPVSVGKSDTTHTIIESGVTAQDHIIVGPYKVLESVKHEQKVKDERKKDEEKL